MIVGTAFDGDNDDELKWIQHDDYERNLTILYSKPRLKYIRAVKLVQKKTELYNKIKDKRDFDHRVLQHHHDLIAAYYRYINPKSNYLKLRFNKNEQNNKKNYRKIEQLKAWREFWSNTVDLLVKNDNIVRTVLKVVGYENTETGYKAEDELIRLLYHEIENYFVKGERFKRACSIAKEVFE